jgi:hypothetical protein
MRLNFVSATIDHLRFTRLFFHSGYVVEMLVLAVTMQGRADAEKELEGVAEVIAIVAVESVRAIIDCELSAEADIEAITV